MGMLVWVMTGLAIWHFTIFIPDRFVGGIVGAFCGAIIGSIVSGLLINGVTVPGREATEVATALQAIPGTLAGLAAAYALGVSRGNEALEL